jgi:hypothetical protein
LLTAQQFERAIGDGRRDAGADACHALTARRANLPHRRALVRLPRNTSRFARPASRRGRIAIVTNVCAGCGGRGWRARRVRRSRTAKPRGPDVSTLISSWRQCSSIAPATVTNKPDHRGERGISRKTIARGMPECFGVPVVTMLVCFHLLHTRLRVRLERPAFPAPSVFLRVTNLRQPGHDLCCGNAKTCPWLFDN